jgi:cell division protein FtsA
VTNDIAIGLRTDIEVAEKVKLKYAKAHTSGRVNPSEKLRIEELGGENAIVPKRDLYDIVQARLEEIFTMVGEELAKVGKAGMLPAGVVLTGGGAKMEGIEELAKEVLRLPVTVGQPSGLSGLTDKVSDPAFAAPVGLMLENMQFAGPVDRANVKLGETVDKIRKTLRNLLP